MTTSDSTNSMPPTELIESTGITPETPERRVNGNRRVRRDRRKGIRRSVGLEVSPLGVALAIVEDTGESTPAKLITEHVLFPSDHGPATGDWSDGTLKDRLIGLSSKYQLSGQAIQVGIGGDPCVTRVVAGENNEVDQEIEELTHRTRHYIGMGLGDKVSCESTVKIDAKRKRTWVTVAMRDVVEEIIDAVTAAGMRLTHIEHTMLVLCRILHGYEQEQDEPVMLIVDEMGRMDLGISYKGQLLLDYRPAMPDDTVTEGSLVQRHSKSLRRYVQSQLPNVEVNLTTVYVTGTESHRAALYKSIDDQPDLHPRHFPIETLSAGLQVIGDVTEDPGMLAAIGLARLPQNDLTSVGAGRQNDLMSIVRTQGPIPWLTVLRCTWPLTAAAMLTMAFWFAGNHEHTLAAAAEATVESFAADNAEVRRLKHLLGKHIRMEQQIETFERNIKEPEWAKLLWRVGSLLPKGVWFDTVEMDHHSTIAVVGGSFTNEAIYEYIHGLKQAGLFSRVVLESTNTTRIGDGPAFKFEISAKVSEPEKNAEPDSNQPLVMR